MPLPIPDILQNAGNVLEEAANIVRIFGDKPEFAELKSLSKKVNSNDLLAVMNEVGKVYVGIHKLQVQQIGSRANTERRTFDVAMTLEFGLGPRTVVTPLPIAVATDMIKTFNEDLAKLTGTTPGSKLITAQ